MPKKFSEKQKSAISGKLISIGIEMFSRFGFSKTSIDEIIKQVGISKGSFYSFYDSKESYFMDVLEEIEADTRAQMNSILENKDLTPAQRFKEYMSANIDSMEKNPMLSNMHYQDIENLILILPSERIDRHMEKDIKFTIELIESLRREAGQKSKVSYEAISGMFQFIFYIFLHRNEIGVSQYRAGMQVYIDMMSNYLFG